MSLDLEEVKQEISQLALELKKRKRFSAKPPSEDSGRDIAHSLLLPPILPLSLPSWEPSYPHFGNRVHYKELKNFDDRAFVGAAYRALLGHPPDPQGEAEYLQRLRNGTSKAEILVRLRYSAEGKNRSVRMRGLLIPAALAFLEKIPILGRLFGYLKELLLFPSTLRKIRRQQALLAEQLQQSNALIEERINSCILHLNHLRFSAPDKLQTSKKQNKNHSPKSSY